MIKSTKYFEEECSIMSGVSKQTVKNNLITKPVYVYEDIENEAPKSKRHRPVNPYCFCGVNSGKGNEEFRDEVYDYIDAHYELSKVKKIYVNSDGGSRIKSGMKRLGTVTHVPDEFKTNGMEQAWCGKNGKTQSSVGGVLPIKSEDNFTLLSQWQVYNFYWQRKKGSR